jgi:protein TonB
VPGPNSRALPPPPIPEPVPEAKPQAPSRILVGGKVMEAKLIRRVIPVYPPLARQARVQGVVRLDAIIARDGTIQDLRVASGHPFLVAAAVEAVRQWLYQPTRLNDVPVEVITRIDVNFTLR